MQSLWNEVQNLKATAKSWEIVTLTTSNVNYPFPFDGKYASWNFEVLTYSMRSGGASNSPLIHKGNNSVSANGKGTNNDFSCNWVKSGNSLKLSSGRATTTTITVLFYK